MYVKGKTSQRRFNISQITINFSNSNSSFSSKLSPIRQRNPSTMTSGGADLYSQIANLEAQNNDYKKQVADLESRLSKLMMDKKMSQQEISLFFNNEKEIDQCKGELRKTKQELYQLQAFVSAQSNLSNTSLDDNSLLDMKNKIHKDISEKESGLSKTIANLNLKVSDLEKKLAFSNAENAQLTVHNLELEKMIRKLNGDGDISGAKTQRLQETLEELQQRIEIQKNENEKDRRVRDKLQKKNQELSEDNSRLNEEINKLTQKNSYLEEQLTILNTEKSALKDTIKSVEKEKTQLSQKIQQINNEAERLNFELNSKNTELLNSQKEIEKHKKSYDEQLNQSQRFNDQNSMYAKQISQYKDKLDKESEKLHQVTEENTQLKFQINQLKEKLSKQQYQNEMNESQLSDFKLQLSQKERQFSRQVEKNQNADNRIEDLQNQIARLTKVNERQKQEIQANSEKLLQYEDQISQHQNLYMQTKDENSKNLEEIKDIKSQLIKEKQRYQLLRKENEKAQEAVSQYEQQLSRTRRESDTFGKKSVLFENQLSEALQIQQKLKLDLQNAKVQLQQVQNQKIEIELEMKSLKKEKNKLEMELKEKNQENELTEEEAQHVKEQLQKLRIEFESIQTAATMSSKMESDLRKKMKENSVLKQQYEKALEENSKLSEKLNEVWYSTSNERSAINDYKDQLEKSLIANRELKHKHMNTSTTYQAAVRKIANFCMKKLKAIEAQYITNLDMMAMRIDHLSKSLQDLASFYHRKDLNSNDMDYQRRLFLKQIQKHLDIIETITETTGKVLQIDNIPPATDLINHPDELKHFLNRITGTKPDNHFCRHTESQIKSFLGTNQTTYQSKYKNFY